MKEWKAMPTWPRSWTHLIRKARALPRPSVGRSRAARREMMEMTHSISINVNPLGFVFDLKNSIPSRLIPPGITGGKPKLHGWPKPPSPHCLEAHPTEKSPRNTRSQRKGWRGLFDPEVRSSAPAHGVRALQRRSVRQIIQRLSLIHI